MHSKVNVNIEGLAEDIRGYLAFFFPVSGSPTFCAYIDYAGEVAQ